MDEPKYEDHCSACGQPCTRVEVPAELRRPRLIGRMLLAAPSAQFMTSCCGAAMVAKAKE